MAKKKRETKRKEIRKSLVEQLKNKGADEAMFLDQIEDYMMFWDQKESLKSTAEIVSDMIERIVQDDDWDDSSEQAKVILNANKQMMDGYRQIRDTNRQMLSILKAMDITTEKIIKKDGGYDDL